MEERNFIEIALSFAIGAGWTWACVTVGRQLGRMQERRSHIAQLYEWMARNEGPAAAPAFPPAGCRDRAACREAGFCLDGEDACAGK